MGMVQSSVTKGANQTEITNEDFARADKFLSAVFGTVPKEVLNADISYQWLDNGKELFYKFQEPSNDWNSGKKNGVPEHIFAKEE